MKIDLTTLHDLWHALHGEAKATELRVSVDGRRIEAGEISFERGEGGPALVRLDLRKVKPFEGLKMAKKPKKAKK